MSGLTTLNTPGSSLSLPTVNDATITIAGDVTGSSTFSTNQAAAETINLSLDNDVVDSAEIADGAIDAAHIATDAVTQAKIADNAVNEARLQISNTGTNGQFLSKQSGNTGGLTWATAGGSGNNTSTTAVGAYAMVAATNPTNTNVGTGTSFAGNSNVYQYGGVTAGVNNYSYSLAGSGAVMARNGNIPSGTWHFRGAGGQNTGRCTLCQRTA